MIGIHRLIYNRNYSYEIYYASWTYFPKFSSEVKINHIQSIKKGFLDLGEYFYLNIIDCVCWLLIQILHVFG